VRLIEEGYRQHGRIFSFKLGSQPCVMLLGPELNRFFFEETDKLLSIRDPYPFFIRMFGNNIYYLAEPAEYKEQRAIVVPCFQGKRMNGYVGVIAKEAEIFMHQLGDEGVFELVPTLGPVALNVAARAFLGDDFRERLSPEFFKIFREFSGGIEFVLPLWLPLPHLRRSQIAKQTLHREFARVIAERRSRPQQREGFLQTLIESHYSDGRPLSDEVIINLILLLSWAGHETTTGHLSWAIADLLEQPAYLRSVRAEQDAVLGESDALDAEKLRALRRMDWALRESERLHPVSYILVRKARQDIDVAGYRIPEGTLVLLSPWVSHRIPEVFAVPNAYDPERFAPDRAEDKHPYSLIGFGGGTHRCAGMNFAYLEMKIIVTLLLRRYDLELLDQARPTTAPTTRCPASPCRVRYRRRRGAIVSRDDRGVRSAADAAVAAVNAVANEVALPPSDCPFHNADAGAAPPR
jgi:sterol 14-demethylase